MYESTRDYWRRVRDSLGWRSIAVAAGLALLLASQALFHPRRYEFWTLLDVALAWSVYYGEVALIAVTMLVVVVLVEQWPRARPSTRALLVVPALAVPVFGLVWLASWRYSGAWLPQSWLPLAGETTKFTLLGALVFALRAMHRRAEAARAASRALEADQAELELQAEAAQLQLLQAQIEPHFLFNTLANIRRLLRTEPAAGVATIDSLRTYLQAALPQVRRTSSTLGDEFDLLQAYLQLFKVRMGARLRYRLDIARGLRALPYPPMLLVTLAENAIKHGLAPSDLGGTIRVSARRESDGLAVEVADDGVGFGGAAGGTGVGLVNIRRQLAARYGETASLRLSSTPGGGVTARIVTPWPELRRDVGASLVAAVARP